MVPERILISRRCQLRKSLLPVGCQLAEIPAHCVAGSIPFQPGMGRPIGGRADPACRDARRRRFGVVSISEVLGISGPLLRDDDDTDVAGLAELIN